MTSIAVVDVGLGNLRSVVRALEEVARRSEISTRVTIETEPDAVRRADKIVVPGQGAFRDCATAMGRGMGEALRESIARGTSYLGLCLGLQILFEKSEEAPACPGLGVFRGSVKRLLPASGIKIPHVGWNEAEWRDRPAEYFYFVHSYVVVPEDDAIASAWTTHGQRFVSAIAKDNVTAVQFHPEKSQDAGLALLERFLKA